MRARRHRVVVRSKVRGQRAKKAAAVAAVAVLGGLAAATVRQLRRDAPTMAALRLKLAPSVTSVEVEGAPEPLRAKLAAYLAPAGARLDGADHSADLLTAFPCLSSSHARRRWLARELVYRVSLKTAVAAVAGGGYLGADGSIFSAEQGLTLPEKPVVDAAGAPADQLKGLAGFLQETASPAAFLSPLAAVRYTAQGWQLSFEDGTTALWGDFRWTPQKLVRLREVLLDGRGQFSRATLAADLRYFEDGRILLRPAGAKL